MSSLGFHARARACSSQNVLLGVTAREGCGVFREGGSVACWGAVVQSARAEMDRFAVFSKGDTVCAGVFDGHGVKGSVCLQSPVSLPKQ